jgi:hypothetical protein
MRKTAVAVATLCAAAALAGTTHAATTEQMSVASDGTPGNDWSFNWRNALSWTGRFVAFDSDAMNLVPDTNTTHNVYVRDRDSDRDGIFDEPGSVATVRVNVSTEGAEQDYGGSYSQTAISPEGRFVAFVADATNFDDADSGTNPDVFVRDRDTDGDWIFDEPGAVKTLRVSEAPDGTEANDYSWFPFVSAGGRFVAFQSFASNLAADDDNGSWDIYVRDRDTDRDGRLDEPGAVSMRRVSLSTAGEQANNDSQFPSFSLGSRFLAFASYADNLVPGDTNGAGDIFLRDRNSDRDRLFDEPGAVKTVRLSLSSAGAEADGESNYPAISASGRFVVFSSSATNLVPGDTNGLEDIFVRDRDADRDGRFDEPGAVRTVRVNVSSEGLESNGPIHTASISATGRFVAFNSGASNLVSDDLNGVWDVFLRDRDTDRDGIFDEPGAVATIRTSLTALSEEVSEGSGTPSLSLDGRWTVFTSGAREFHADGSPIRDVFARGPLP